MGQPIYPPRVRVEHLEGNVRQLGLAKHGTVEKINDTTRRFHLS